ncbi:interleukin-12 subunit beta [Hoplias malabaricus]|uniref:interleukin-12 subunit beta n=1 Tax=Hoplias malabaricus TaxID=27720 RepID=UPI0034624D27
MGVFKCPANVSACSKLRSHCDCTEEKMNLIFYFALHLTILHVGDGASLQVVKPNVVALEVSGDPMTQTTTVSLLCGEQLEGTEILWRRNGQTIPQKGKSIEVTVQAMLGGNYTCHSSAGELLNHTLVLVKPVDFQKAILTHTGEDYITCTASNYNGVFHCSWRWDSARNGLVVLFRASRGSEQISCSLDSDQSGLRCEELKCSPHAEEVTRISLTLLVRNQYRLEEHHISFFIREIIKPDKVDIVKAEDDEFKWENPKTWSTPCTYYPLRYEVKVLSHRRSCDHIGNHSESNYTNETEYKVTSRKSYTFCVRAQDFLTNQVWSEWSQQKVHKHK